MKLSEFRQDLVSGEWVLFATGRKSRPHVIAEQKEEPIIKDCPFDDLSSQKVLWTHTKDDFMVTLIQNKYPAVEEGQCAPMRMSGPFPTHPGSGNHEVFVYPDHATSLSDFSVSQMTGVLEAFKKRYQEIATQGDCVQYIHIFHNSGKDAGASVAHPHSQVISMPILPPDISRSLHGARRFYEQNQQRAYDVMVSWEKEQNKRIVYENNSFIAFCPFASKYPYEVRIFGKESHAHFEKMPDELNTDLAEAMSVVLKKIKLALGDPGYNFFLHTSPIEGASQDPHEFYSWHVEILPKVKIDAGMEIGTGLGVNIIDPDEAAAVLRSASLI